MVWDQGDPKQLLGEDQDKSHLATLLSDCHKFLVRSSTIIKNKNTIYYMSLNVLSLYMHSKAYTVYKRKKKRQKQEIKTQLRNESVQLI